jgi:type IV pilus assembly protein PilC
MPTYLARVRDAKGNAKKKKIVAESPGEARSAPKTTGSFIQDIKQAQSFNLKTNFDFKQLQTALTSVSTKDKAVFASIAALVNAGVAIVRGLGVLAEQTTNPKLKQALLEISADVQQGVNLSEAMRKHPQCFDGLYVSMVQAGEVGGFRRSAESTGKVARRYCSTAKPN